LYALFDGEGGDYGNDGKRGRLLRCTRNDGGRGRDCWIATGFALAMTETMGGNDGSDWIATAFGFAMTATGDDDGRITRRR